MSPLVDPIKEIQAAILGLNHRLRTIEERLQQSPPEPEAKVATREWAVGQWVQDAKTMMPQRILDMTDIEVALGRRVGQPLETIDIKIHPRNYLDLWCAPSQPAAWFDPEED